MIAFLRGILHSVKGDTVVVDVNGVGYLVQVPLSIMPGLPSPGGEILIHTHMAVREDGVSLYGFDSTEALEVFRLLINVSGVGPRGALSILSVITPGGLAAAVREDNTALITRAPGIGKKTAQRIILDLKDKFGKEEYVSAAGMPESDRADGAGEAVEALVSLGFGAPQAVQAVDRAGKKLGRDAATAEIVRHALKILADSR
ncbi:MAG: Holliday junction branch migration protein RuvA [Bacillota bacterium]